MVNVAGGDGGQEAVHGHGDIASGQGRGQGHSTQGNGSEEVHRWGVAQGVRGGAATATGSGQGVVVVVVVVMFMVVGGNITGPAQGQQFKFWKFNKKN